MTAAPLREFWEPAEDRGNLEETYREMFAPLVRYARRRLPKESDPEDIVQDSFMKVLERVDVGALASAPAFVTKVVQHGVIAELRSRAVRERRSTGMADPVTPDPALAIEDQELLEAASELVDRLPARQRRLLGLYLLGLSPSEIASLESDAGEPVNANQVSTTLTRAKSRLRSNLKRNGFAVMPIWWKDLTRWVRWKLARVEWFLGAEFAATATAMVIATSVLILSTNIVGADKLPGAELRASNSGSELMRFPNEGARLPAPPPRDPTEAGSAPALLRSAAAGNQETNLWERDEMDPDGPGVIDQVMGWIRDPGMIPTPGCKGLPVCP